MIERLAAALTGDRRDAEVLGALEVEAVATCAEEQGVLPLLAEQLAALGLGSSRLAETLKERVRRHAAADLVREDEIRGLGEALVAGSVPALLIKGAHLAYTVYPRPDLRPRLDTDVLVRESDRQLVIDVLLQRGYEAVAQAGGDLVSYQSSFAITRQGGLSNVVDLHWRIANPQAFGTVITYDDLDGGALPVPELGGARAPGLVDALQVACLHRVAHHADHERLIWLHDIVLLARALEVGEWDRWLTSANERGIGRVCRQEVARAAVLLGARVPERVLADPRFDSRDARSAPTSSFLTAGRRHANTVAQDMRLLPSWPARVRLARQHLLPSRAYMRTVYAPSSSAPLSWLYVRRAMRGAKRWFARRPA